MAKRKKKDQDYDEVIVDVVDASEAKPSFLETNGKNLLFGLLALGLLVGAYFVYKSMFKDPRQKEAVEQMYMAQFQFDQDSFALALTNPGDGYPGFVDIVTQYSGTKAGNLANYYAAVSYVRSGDLEAGLSYLKSFSPPTSLLTASKNGLMGDIISENGDLEGALSYYQKAAGTDDQTIAPYYLKKLGLLQTKLGKAEEATKTFEQIKKKYPTAPESRDIDKFL